MKRLVRTMAVMLALSASVAMQAATKAPLSTTNLELQQQKKYVVVNGNGVRLRFEPNLNSSWLRYDNGKPRYAPKGTKLTYLGEKGDFYYVEYAGYKLYISKQYRTTSLGTTAPPAICPRAPIWTIWARAATSTNAPIKDTLYTSLRNSRT